MKTLIKIAWRNIWRNKLRSLVVICSIILGIWAGIFINGFSYGLNRQRTLEAIQSNLSHIQIHDTAWSQDPNIANQLQQSASILRALEDNPQVKAFSSRMLLNGIVASANGNGGAQITGIEPATENRLTGLAEKITEGDFLADKKNKILLGKALADKLKARIGSKVVVTFTDREGVIISGAFKVAGIYRGTSSQIEQLKVYVRQQDLQKLLSENIAPHEIALLTSSLETVEPVQQELQRQFPDYTIQSWDELSPELGYADEIMGTMLYLIIGIIMLALSFGIVNTMLMAVLERRKELGMLMAVGMSKRRVFSMILLETLMLSLCGGPLGILLGFLTIWYTGSTGIDLSVFAEGLQSFGISSVIYPSIETSFYFGTGLLVVVMALLSSLYPARRALKLNPIEAIRTI
ncbi:MAG TPA: ABC transporter permease [Cryomorphaceae bacterium]|nr:ABC transporter permease [Owenweeksia sp.]HAD98178.1 ABC transporter permease [Cryomorphaceae bacterium]HBF22013.1 ABC transporter permease [Cryomorphaceae bacterium]HCQ15477.1 ABC transporter permease [Cryomorphaceae bacterium]|tara:strand:- start:7392 stop:8609 length:1218 start_codon:yes stop_codon:yes gene_type:complete